MPEPLSPKPLAWPVVAFFLTLTILFFGAVGVVARVDQQLLVRLFDLDYEHNLPTAFSGLLLFANAWIVLRLKRSKLLGNWGLGLSAVFLFMGCDEIFRFHERMEKLVQVDFQILFLPVIILAFGGWTHVLLKLRRDRGALAFWLAGATAWGASQLLEAAEWGWWTGPDIQADGYVLMMIVEEILEMFGSAFFLLALLKFRQTNASKETLEVSESSWTDSLFFKSLAKPTAEKFLPSTKE